MKRNAIRNAMKRSDMKTVLLAGFAAVAFGGCAAMPERSRIEADLAPASGSGATGTVVFSEHGDKVLVEADIKGLTPGLHGFHIHEKGDCSAADASSAGGHFNPTGAPHGSPSTGAHHVGDLPMLVADESGRAKLHAELDSLALQGANSVVGRAVVVHAQADDFQSQPSGNSGARVACGVIAAK